LAEKPQALPTERGNPRIPAWSGWAGTSVGHPAQPPAEAGSPRAGGTAPWPGGAGISPEKETQQRGGEGFAPPQSHAANACIGLAAARGNSEAQNGEY